MIKLPLSSTEWSRFIAKYEEIISWGNTKTKQYRFLTKYWMTLMTRSQIICMAPLKVDKMHHLAPLKLIEKFDRICCEYNLTKRHAILIELKELVN